MSSILAFLANREQKTQKGEEKCSKLHHKQRFTLNPGSHHIGRSSPLYHHLSCTVCARQLGISTLERLFFIPPFLLSPSLECTNHNVFLDNKDASQPTCRSVTWSSLSLEDRLTCHLVHSPEVSKILSLLLQ